MLQKKPVIGLTPLYDAGKASYWMLPGYMKGLEEAGAVPVMLPLTDSPQEIDRFFDFCDGIVLTGGQDVTPACYGAELILSILVDTFCSRISLSMPPIPKSHNTACVLS